MFSVAIRNGAKRNSWSEKSKTVGLYQGDTFYCLYVECRMLKYKALPQNVRELEEQNLALVDKLHMAQQEIATLHTQLAKVLSNIYI